MNNLVACPKMAIDDRWSKAPGRVMLVPVMGMVAKCTMNTTNPIGNGVNIYINKHHHSHLS